MAKSRNFRSPILNVKGRCERGGGGPSETPLDTPLVKDGPGLVKIIL